MAFYNFISQIIILPKEVMYMFNGSRFFHLARKWKEEGKDASYFYILQDVMDHYFGSIAGYHKSYNLVIKEMYPATTIAFVLDAVGYHDYTIDSKSLIGKVRVILRNTL